MFNAQPGVGIRIYGPRTISESCPKIWHNLWYFTCTICGLKKGPL